MNESVWDTPRLVIDAMERLLLDGPRPQHELLAVAKNHGVTESYTTRVINELVFADRLVSFQEDMPNGKKQRLLRLSEWNMRDMKDPADH